jgi:hypothetical protein
LKIFVFLKAIRPHSHSPLLSCALDFNSQSRSHRRIHVLGDCQGTHQSQHSWHPVHDQLYAWRQVLAGLPVPSFRPVRTHIGIPHCSVFTLKHRSILPTVRYCMLARLDHVKGAMRAASRAERPVTSYFVAAGAHAASQVEAPHEVISQP